MSPSIAHYSSSGISFDYPASWQLRPQNAQLRYGTVLAFVGTAQSQAPCGSSTPGAGCETGWNLEPGTVSVELRTQDGPPRPGPLFEQPVEEGSTRVTVGGLPAIMSTTGNFKSGGNMEISWAISMPGNPTAVYLVVAAAMEPGVDDARIQVESLIASVQFVPPVEPLPTGVERDAAVSRAVDSLAASDPGFTCFPRTIGGTADAVIQYVPFYSKLRRPVPVRCSTDIEETPIALWRLILTVSWDAAHDRTGGSNVARVWVDRTGQPGGSYGGGSDAPPYWP